MRCPKYKAVTAEQAAARGWCDICEEPCMKFDPIEFVEFAGGRGVDAIIVRTGNATYFRLASIPRQKLNGLLQEFIKAKMGVGE